MLSERTEGLDRKVVEFCRFARARGLSGGVKESLDSLAAVRLPGIDERNTFRLALRAVLCSSKEDWDRFDELFRAFWNAADVEPPGAAPRRRERKSRGAKSERGRAASERPASVGTAKGPTEEGGGRAVLGASAMERLRKTDFSLLSQEDVEALDRLALRLFRRMALRLSRRLRMANTGAGPVDLRRTIRRGIPRGGELMELRYRIRKRKPGRLVILLDVSGSMNPYSLFLLKFAYALQKHFQRIDTFLFSTQLVEITAALKTPSLSEALAALSREDAGWAGGTKIGESLREFLRLHGRKLLSRDTLLMILSDGWDTGEPELLAAELEAAKRRAGKLIWLNPLLGLEGYEPVTRGMSAALPFLDVFAPAHNLESLLALERHLIPSRGR
jgi:uncharacterized protein with von Willebrand factor type A (vWA) domain